MEFNLYKGATYETEFIVDKKDSAAHYGSGEVEVLATPCLIGWMENASLNAVKPMLPEGFDTVGTVVNIKHLAATPIGMRVRVVAELTEVNGKFLEFKVKAYDEKDKIGEGTHQRAVIETKKFLKRVNSKLA